MFGRRGGYQPKPGNGKPTPPNTGSGVMSESQLTFIDRETLEQIRAVVCKGYEVTGHGYRFFVVNGCACYVVPALNPFHVHPMAELFEGYRWRDAKQA